MNAGFSPTQLRLTWRQARLPARPGRPRDSAGGQRQRTLWVWPVQQGRILTRFGDRSPR